MKKFENIGYKIQKVSVLLCIYIHSSLYVDVVVNQHWLLDWDAQSNTVTFSEAVTGGVL